ncbi:hypothetical protein SUGI_0824120 [Cryptomeria japonica]|nr:hypothetical protein SUGI_0824120 [Cryptomeria japonica]
METYGDGSQVNSLLSNDSLTVGSHSMPGFIFGCAISRTGNMPSTPGLVGFGRKSLSFVSQTANLFNQTISYCIPYSDSTGCLELGNDALSPAYFQFTASVPKIDESVGGERVDLESATIIDSGTTITRLVEPFYSAVRDTFLLQFQNYSLSTGSRIFDTCFNISSKYIDVPLITLNFDNYVDVALPSENYLIPVNEEGSVLCLAFMPPPVNFALRVSVVWSFQQPNFQVVYDIPGSRLGIAPQNCNGCSLG